jgi:AmmeMemoRadiSam system protein A
MWLTDEERLQLLHLARQSIESALRGREYSAAGHVGGALDEPHGVFVTLRIRGELRGCVGYIEPKLRLADAVVEVARKAALEDPRFPPVNMTEWGDILVEVSVLSSLEQMTNPEEIEVGKHGLVIDAGFARGLLLPQVASEQHWSREEFLRRTALKAGLPPDAWRKSGIRLYRFTTETISETSTHTTVVP